MWDNIAGSSEIRRKDSMFDHLPEKIKAQLSKRPKDVLMVDEKGRVLIPSYIRKELGIKEGDALIISVRDGEIVLVTRALLTKRMHDKYLAISPEISLSDELLAERREEARREAEEVERERSRNIWF
jgi:AbrB family looped-hinge helix DNA binding protein